MTGEPRGTGPDLRADKKLGQHFLHDWRVLERIAAALPRPVDAPELIEIGPGPGALTEVLLADGYSLKVIEKDPRWQLRMEELAVSNPGRLTLAGDDALVTDWPRLLNDRQPVVGNLPYNIGTEIVVDLVRLAATAHGGPREMLFMLQKEVVQRICARPGPDGTQADWGRLGVLCDLLCDRTLLFDVAPGAFKPPPKVMSSVVRLVPLAGPRYAVNMGKLDRVLRQAFGQRRKMLRASLKGTLDEAQLVAAGVDPTARPETVTTAQFCRLAELLA